MRDYSLKLLDPSLFLAKLTPKPSTQLALVLHQSADPDAVGSAAALAALLTATNQSTSHLFAESLNRSAKQIAATFALSFEPVETLAEYDTVVFIDLNNLEQAGTLAEHLPKRSRRIFCIDHHVRPDDMDRLVDFALIDEELRSTAELILQLWKASGASMSAQVATLLACGLVYDSRHLQIALPSTFENLLVLLRQGAEYPRVLELLSTPLDRSERIARLKAASRVVVYDEYGLLVAATTIQSYEASACRALMDLGADIAIACAVKKDEVRVSARCSAEVIRDYGLDLAKQVMEPLGELIGGAGGGHPAAAGANGTATSDYALGLALQILRKALKARHPSSATPGSGEVR
jgi:nanoRNase/pAp phosphatase (c-di-AMP/oligoRNAs hydrolase)